MEFCNLHTFGAPAATTSAARCWQPDETAHVFELSGHMHRHGKRFQIFRGAFTCTGGTNAGQAC